MGDSGRCPVCGKVYQWKLLNHVAKDHQKVLKPAHLSYKCTVCTATFGQYKLFENHVYTAHSGGAKKGNASSGQRPSGSSHNTNPKQPIKVSDEITIIPQKKIINAPLANNSSSKKKSIEVTSLPPSKSVLNHEGKDLLRRSLNTKSNNGEPVVKKAKVNESLDESSEGVEQVEEIEEDDD